MSQEPPPQPPRGYYPAPPKSRMSTGAKVALGVIIACCVVIGGCFACATFIWENSKRNLNLNSAVSGTTPEQIKGVIAVPNEIWMSYEKNPRAADSVYQFQQVRLFGRVSEVRRDIIHGYPQVLFTAKGKRSSGEVVCVFDTSSAADQERARILKPDDQAEITGTCAGKQGGMIMILQCSIHQ